jgi:glutamate-ammonia-ligase adenylyltransferase
VDLKTGHGGLVDVEFYVQGKILVHGKNHPRVLLQNTLEALTALRNEGLVGQEPFHTMDAGYRFLTNLEDRLRIMEHRSVDRMPIEGDKLRGLARRLGYPAGEEHRFLSDYFEITEAIRKTYSSFFGVK